MTSLLLRWIAVFSMVVPGSSVWAQRMPSQRFAPAIAQRLPEVDPAQDDPLARLRPWPADCQHGQGVAFATGAVAGAVTGWFAYQFVAMGVFAPDSPSKRNAVRTSMAVGAGVVGVFSMYQWHRQCGPGSVDLTSWHPESGRLTMVGADGRLR